MSWLTGGIEMLSMLGSLSGIGYSIRFGIKDWEFGPAMDFMLKSVREQMEIVGRFCDELIESKIGDIVDVDREVFIRILVSRDAIEASFQAINFLFDFNDIPDEFGIKLKEARMRVLLLDKVLVRHPMLSGNRLCSKNPIVEAPEIGYWLKEN